MDNVKLTGDYKFLAQETGVPIPFLPFRNADENGEEDKIFARLILQHPTLSDNELARLWCQKIDGVKIFPKLPVYIRIQRERFNRNMRIKESHIKYKQSLSDIELLHQSGRMESDLLSNINMDRLDEDLPLLDARESVPLLKLVGGVRMDIIKHTDDSKKGDGEDSVIVSKRGPDKQQRQKRKCSVCHSDRCRGSGKTSLCPNYMIASTTDAAAQLN